MTITERPETLSSIDDVPSFADLGSLLNDRGRRAFELFAVDLYRDIHKGIRSELFAVTTSAGSIDPADRVGHAALVEHVGSVHGVLQSHAHHEDAFVDAPLHAVAPGLSGRINDEHELLEARFTAIADLASDLVRAGADERRRLLQLMHLELSGFTSEYLRHQLVEETMVMPVLARELTFDEVLAIHVGIVSSIPPEEMARSLSFMLPSMNADDRADLLGGMRESAPPDAFDGVLGLAQSVLDPREYRATTTRLGLG